jgi:hypothetical protein
MAARKKRAAGKAKKKAKRKTSRKSAGRETNVRTMTRAAEKAVTTAVKKMTIEVGKAADAVAEAGQEGIAAISNLISTPKRSRKR